MSQPTPQQTVYVTQYIEQPASNGSESDCGFDPYQGFGFGCGDGGSSHSWQEGRSHFSRECFSFFRQCCGYQGRHSFHAHCG